jgi:hypothetical protein
VIWQPLEGQFGRDLDSFTPWFLLFSAVRPWELESFTLAVPLRSGRAEFLKDREVSKTHEWDPCCLDTNSAGA